MIGVRAEGRKELVALADGYRESVESWADLLRDCARRGMRAPVLAMGDGALGFWGALREVFHRPESSAAGFTSSQTYSARYRSLPILDAPMSSASAFRRPTWLPSMLGW